MVSRVSRANTLELLRPAHMFLEEDTWRWRRREERI
jgi:hypothetical protein